MERLFFFSILLLLSFISLSCVQATSNTDDLDYILTGMCTQSSGTIFKRMSESRRFFSSWLQELRSVPRRERVTRYFHPRPADTPESSLCQPMNTTCCKPNAEKHLSKVAKKEYSELFLNVVQEGVGQCFTVGRYFYHAMYPTFTEIRRQIEIPLNNALDQKLNVNLFDDFFNYLSHFSVNSDLCDLSYYLQTVMNDIFDFVHDGQQGDNLRETYPECYRNVSSQIMENIYEELFNRLERQLYNLDLIYRAMKISEEVLDSLKKHRFSSECTRPFTQLQNCAQCTGYYKFKPCLFYCINVFRGCFADVADIHYEFRQLTNAFSDIPDDILGTFQPEVFIRDSLIYFVHLAEDLQTRNLKEDIAAVCTDEEGGRQKRKSLHRRQSSSNNIAPVTPTTITQEDNRLLTAFNLELQCMRNIESMLKRIPEMMCYQSREHDTIADSGNQRCWLGSRMGTYWHSQVRFTKEDQIDNPEFIDQPAPYLNQFDDLCIDIATIAAEINETLDLVLCLDDEDCLIAPYYICEPDEFDSLSGSGSGDSDFGSGSGSGGSNGRVVADDGMRDMEGGDDDPSPIDDEDEDDDEDTVTPSIDDVPLLLADAPVRDHSNTTQYNDTTDDEGDGGYVVWEIDGSSSSENITSPSIAATTSTTQSYSTSSTSFINPTPRPPVIDDNEKPDMVGDTTEPDTESTSKPPSPEVNVTSSSTIQLEINVTGLLLAITTFFCLLLA